MLSLHVPGALLEVLLFAIARKLLLLPKTSGMLDLLLGIIAIAFIFVIRKYLMTENERKNTFFSKSMEFHISIHYINSR